MLHAQANKLATLTIEVACAISLVDFWQSYCRIKIVAIAYNYSSFFIMANKMIMMMIKVMMMIKSFLSSLYKVHPMVNCGYHL